jgi:hypothetical protein
MLLKPTQSGLLVALALFIKVRRYVEFDTAHFFSDIYPECSVLTPVF